MSMRIVHVANFYGPRSGGLRRLDDEPGKHDGKPA